MEKVKIIIADDHHIVRKGLLFFFKTKSDLAVIGEASTGKEVLDLLRDKPADIVLMDLSMPEMDGIEATKQIKKWYPSVKVVALTSYADQSHVIPAIQAGAEAYQLKDTEPDELVETIRAVHAGRHTLDPKIMSHVFQHMAQANEKEKIHQLTNREKDVLFEIAKGKSNKEIGAALFITEKTVKTHVSNLLSKLGLSDRTQAALFVVKHNIDPNQGG
ncbi:MULTISPECIES: response regulator [Bacillus]|uniref:Two-component response regulator YhcZ n=2 Tax=Bacillus sonorensis TaxID=119858 RepID=M5P8X9_9BACI|nr:MULTISPECIES: response regulator transcription factor [Bacillus]TWK72606.1 Transcriptional regulatory protein LiaR [Bacillus paralicheniformis]ASB90338.1 Chemotaxis response regulator protein-glutamate methylesterase [Bacillus sonorensis]EME75888.1 two-component response regulator YhcZ [Bacillus sonorensis L12]MBG9916483.1 LuxR family transcriptional regulator [Bacillus sonorensis]MDR4956191.1 response regulator transcription factor [Bacillus sonorensis]